MIIRELNMKNFGRFFGKTIELTKGLNVIYGDNEKGKTTTHSFIRGMFFGIDKPRGRASKDDLYEKYRPWDGSGAFNGSMRIEDNHNEFLISRTFSKDAKSFSCVNETIGRQLDIKNVKQLPFLKDLTESRYRNTISNEQLKSRVDKDLAKEVKNYVANLSTSKDREVDVINAVNILKDKKKKLTANRTKEKIDNICCQMKEDDKVEERILELSGKISNLKAKEKKGPYRQSVKSIEEIKEYVKEYESIKEKYKSYLEIKDQKKVLIDIDSKMETNSSHKKNSATSKFPMLVIVGALILIALVLNKFGANQTGLLVSLLVMGLAGYIMYSYSDKATKMLVTKECKSQMENEQSSRQSIEKLNNLLLKKQNEILEYANRVCTLKEVNDEEMFRLEKEVLVLKNQMEGYVYKQKKEEEESKIEMEKLNWEKAMLENDEPIRTSRKQQYNELLYSYEKEEKELEALDITMMAIEDLSKDIHSDFGMELQELISKYCSIFTGNKYNRVLVESDFNIKVYDQGRYVDIEKLSIGTIEQIYLAVRFAVTEIFEKDTKLPIILDDSFAFYDNKRLICTLRALAGMIDRQIIIFTCHNREENILRRDKLKFNYVEL